MFSKIKYVKYVFVLFVLVLQGGVTLSAQTEFDCSDYSDLDVAECEAAVLYLTEIGHSPEESLCDSYIIRCEEGKVIGVSHSIPASSTIPASIGGLVNLEHLNISGDTGTSGTPKRDYRGLNELPPEISNLTRLKSLNLEHHEFESFPIEITTLTTLESLTVLSKGLDAIPAEIGNLTNLKWLRLGGDFEAPDATGMGRIYGEAGYFYSANFTSLPDEIGNLVNLEYLGLYLSQLSSLPSTIGNLSMLERLDVRGDLLQSFPVEITQLDNLESLQMAGLAIGCSTFETDAFTSWQFSDVLSRECTLDNCETYDVLSATECQTYLDLASAWSIHENDPCESHVLTCEDNMITKISSGYGSITTIPPVIENPNNLQTLNLSYNEIVEIPAEIGNLTTLRYLSVANNPLTTLPDEIGDLINLEQLDLSDTQLQTWPQTITNLNNVSVVSIDNVCKPDAPNIRAWLDNVQTVEGGLCHPIYLPLLNSMP